MSGQASTGAASAPAPRRAGSLRARLLWFLLAAIVLAGAVQALVTYRTVLREADEIFDYHMQQMAMSLRSGLPPSAAVSGLRGGEKNFEFVVQVWTVDGERIFESAEEAALPQRAVLGFSDVNARGTTYRVFSLQARGLAHVALRGDDALFDLGAVRGEPRRHMPRLPQRERGPSGPCDELHEVDSFVRWMSLWVNALTA